MTTSADSGSSATIASTISPAFEAYDLDGNGLVSREEMATSLKTLATQHNLSLSPEKITAMTEAIFQSVKNDLVDSGRRNSHLSPADWTALSRSVLDRRMSYAVVKDLKDKTVSGMLAHFYNVYRQQIWWLVYFYTLQIILFGIGTQRYLYSLTYNGRDYSKSALISLAFGQVLVVNMCLLLFLPAFRFITGRLRRTFFADFIPFDSGVSFHIVVGATSAFLAFFHGGLYTYNIYLNSLKPFYMQNNWTFIYQMTAPGFIGAPEHLGYTSVSGLILTGCMVVMVFFALPPIRNSKLYDAFYWTHKLQFVIWAALMVHSEHCWKYLVGPLAILLFEKTLKYYNTLQWSGTSRIVEVNVLPANVTQLVVKRPKDFDYYPGDYVFIKVPRLGVLNWHPFTLSSCPEQADVLWFHIKASGNWTTELRDFFRKKATDQALIQAHQQNDPSAAASSPGDNLHMQPVVPTLHHLPNLNMRILLDGPYGASSTALFKAEHAVLIGAGIGITPFASVLGSVLAQFRERQIRERETGLEFGTRINRDRLKLKKLNFIWVSRGAENIQWFIDLLEGWEEQQQSMPADKLFMDCQLYLTSIPDKKHTGIAGLSIGMDLHHKVHNKDVITGLRTSTRTGRPDWPAVFAKLDRHKKGSVRVFCCGPPSMARKIRWLATQHKFKFSTEQF